MLAFVSKHSIWTTAKTVLCSLLLLTSFWAQAQPAIGARVDRQRILLGDQIQLELQLTYPVGTQIISVSDAALRGEEKLEIIKTGRLDTISREPGFVLQQFYTITSFDSGYHYVPPFEVLYQSATGVDTARSNPIPLEVLILPADENSELQPIKPILEEPRKLSDLLPYAIAVLALIGIVALVLGLRRRKARIQAPAPPPLPPHIIARQRLDELAGKELWQKGEIKGFQSELTYILRDYLEGRFKMPALESTTAEIDRAIKKKPELSEWRERLNELLRTADLVKFAKATPPLTFHQQALEIVTAFVNDTEPQPEPEPPTPDPQTPNPKPQPPTPKPRSSNPDPQ